MIYTIALKELKELIREGRFRAMAPVILVLLIVATIMGNSYYRWVNDQHTAAKDNARNIWVSQDEKNPHSAAHYGTYAFKPKYPLSLIDQGVDKYAGISIYLEAHKRNDARYMAAQDQTAIARFGELTPDFILLFIIPLFVILTGFNAFSRERESGTLRLLKSQGVSFFSLAGGKWLGVFIVVLLISIPIFILTILFLSRIEDFGEFSIVATIILFLFYVIYYVVFINITLCVSAWSGKSSNALVILLGVWMIACLGMPKVANRVAQWTNPYPTQSQFTAAILEDERNGLDGHNPFNAEAKKLQEETLKKYGVDSLQKLPFNWDGYLMQKGEEHTAQVYFKHNQALKETSDNQRAVYRMTSILSPYLPTRFLSMALCRTDYASHWHFADAAEKYRIMMMNRLNMHFAENSKYGQWSYKADKSLWKDIPDFSYQPAGYQEILGENLNSIAVLFGWVITSSLLLLISVKRMTVL